MVFCNNGEEDVLEIGSTSHNPYFNRWFSAISEPKKERFIVTKSQSLF